MNQDYGDMMSTVEQYGFDRRTLLKGLTLFLGGAAISNGLSACDSSPYIPESLKRQSQEINRIQKTWAVPDEIKLLGHDIVRVVGHVENLVQNLLKQLSESPNTAQTNAKQLGQTIKNLHLESARKGDWIEVRAWRLTAIEVAAYALCSYEAPTR